MTNSNYHSVEYKEEGEDDPQAYAHIRRFQLHPYVLAVGLVALIVTAAALGTERKASAEHMTDQRHASVVILTGVSQTQGLGDFVKGVSSAVLIAEIMNSTFYSVAGVSTHGYSSSQMMGVEMDNRTIESFSGGVCDVMAFLSSEIQGNLYKSCLRGGEAIRQQVRTALAGCGVMIMTLTFASWTDNYQNYKCLSPWIRKHLPPGIPPPALHAAWSESTNRILVHYRYGDLATLGYVSTKQTSIEEVNEFLDGVQRFPGNSTVVIIAEDYSGTIIPGVTSAHQVFNDSTIAESFWLAEHSTHLFTSESGFSQLLRIAANLSAPSFIPTRLYHMDESGQFDTVAALPLSAIGLLSGLTDPALLENEGNTSTKIPAAVEKV